MLYSQTDKNFDLVVIGAGFGSLFFIKRVLSKIEDLNIAVVEWGDRLEHMDQLELGANSNIAPADTYSSPLGHKPWNFTIGVGGGLNCWWAQSMRLLPNDFRMKSKYGVLLDWPYTYDELEPYYLAAEEIMSISGDDAMSLVSPRSEKFPVRAHRMNSVDELMIDAVPEHHFPIATARAPINLPDRGVCCASAKCHLCPVDAKFSAFNGMADVLNHESITWFLNAEAREIIHENGRAKGVKFRRKGGERVIFGDEVLLGANAIHSPAILLRSGISHPLTGVGLREQVGSEFEVLLDLSLIHI